MPGLYLIGQPTYLFGPSAESLGDFVYGEAPHFRGLRHAEKRGNHWLSAVR